MNFNSVLIGSEDPSRLTGYYTKLLGEPQWNDGGYAGWMVGSGVFVVGPHSEVKGANPEPGRIIVNFESTDVAADFERLKAAGAIVVRAPYEFEGEPGSAIATLSDPDGNYFQLMRPMAPPAG